MKINGSCLTTWLVLVLILCTLGTAATTQAADIPNSSDHPLVGRYQGSIIKRHMHKAYEETSLVVGPIESHKERNDIDKHSVSLAGRLTKILYEGPAERSLLEVIRNYQGKLEKDGFETVFFCRQKECGHATTFWGVAGEGSGLLSQWNSQIYAVLKRQQNGQVVWVSFFGVEFGGSGGRPLTPQVSLTVLETEAMEEDKIVVFDAQSINLALDSTGRIALYGIFFDFDQAEIQPDSKEQIEEIASLLRAQSELNILVVGHTDNQGAIDYNAGLSRRRAEAVTRTLIEQHGISSERLTPVGAGMAAPLSSNKSEEGRAKNRRVEIVER